MAKNLDVVGILLFVSGCVLTMLGLSWVGAEYQWESEEVLGMLLGGSASFAMFFVYALMPPKLFKNRYYFALVTNALFASMTYSVLYVFWPTVVAKVFGGNSYYVAWQTSMLNENLPKYVAPVAEKAGLPPSSLESLYVAIKTGNVSEVPSVNLRIINAVESAVPKAYAESFKMVFLLSTIFTGSMWLNAMFLPNMETFLNPTVARRLRRPEGPGGDNHEDEEQGIELGNISQAARTT
ncbi:trichothecene efflux pump [Colletotrichum tofieldiae]|nr:trichothecene efflux pump [Colletotrichum tofieldiae]